MIFHDDFQNMKKLKRRKYLRVVSQLPHSGVSWATLIG